MNTHEKLIIGATILFICGFLIFSFFSGVRFAEKKKDVSLERCLDSVETLRNQTMLIESMPVGSVTMFKTKTGKLYWVDYMPVFGAVNREESRPGQ